MTAYEVALTAATVAAVAEVAAIWDRLVPGLVEEVPPVLRAVLIDLLARCWAVYGVRGRGLAAAAGYRITGRVPPPLVDPDLPRLTRAAETLLDRAADMEIGAAGADARRPRDVDLETALRDLTTQRLREARDRLAADEAERAAALRYDAEEAEIAEAVARADAEAQAAATEAERRQRIEDARADLRADREAAAAERAATREAEMRAARERRQEQQQRQQERVAARAERRRAQLARAQNVARSETAQAAAEALPVALAEDTRFVGWTRKVNNTACARCLAWWHSGGDPRGASPVRPWSVKMKRHHGCTCLQVPATQEIADVRGRTDEPEPRFRNKPTAADT